MRSRGDTVKAEKIWKRKNVMSNISVGVNTSYLFGSLSNIRRVIFEDTTLAFNTRMTRSTTVNDVMFNFGGQYRFRLDSVKTTRWVSSCDTCPRRRDTVYLPINITLGLTYTPMQSLSASQEVLTETYSDNTGVELVRDTVENFINANQQVVLPAMYGFGFSVTRGAYWMLSADVSYQDWSSFRINGVDPGLKNSLRGSLGMQWRPKNIQYRAGARYNQTYLELKGSQLNEYAVSFGMTLPVFSSRLGPWSYINTSVELGQRGTTKNQLVREDFGRIVIGFTINDRWFIQRKID